jgi:hypothetical protein
MRSQREVSNVTVSNWFDSGRNVVADVSAGRRRRDRMADRRLAGESCAAAD